MTETGLRVVVAEDNLIYRRAIRDLLALGGLKVVGEAATGDEAVVAVRGLKPDVIVMDLRMPDANGVCHPHVGIEATRQILGSVPAPKVLVLTTVDDGRHAERALAAGAVGYLVKGTDEDHIVSAIRAAAEDGASMADASSSQEDGLRPHEAPSGPPACP